MAYEVIQNGEVIGTSDILIHIFFGENGAYQECPQGKADGFCVKLPKEFDIGDGTTETAHVDTVFALPGHTLKGNELEAEYRENPGKEND